jgi:polysaccharide biosynthesis/export protein
MAKCKNFINLLLILNLIVLIPVFRIPEAYAEQKSYRRIFPGSVSPKPDAIQTRDSRSQMESTATKEKQLLESEQEQSILSKEGAILGGGKPAKVHYKIAVNDKLYIAVWRVPDLSLEFIVGPDGNISYPLIGDVRATGKTLSMLDAEITDKLKEYVNDPEVSIVVREFAGDRVVVLGEVHSPGIYKFVGNTRIMNVIALAGGFSDRAKSANIVIVREPEDQNEDLNKEINLITVDTKSILKGHYKNNIEIRPNDIVYVSRTFISNVKEFYDYWIVPAVNTTIDYETWRNLRVQHPR